MPDVSVVDYTWSALTFGKDLEALLDIGIDFVDNWIITHVIENKPGDVSIQISGDYIPGEDNFFRCFLYPIFFGEVYEILIELLSTQVFDQFAMISHSIHPAAIIIRIFISEPVY